MKRLGVVAISLCVVLAVLCSAAIARGRAMPAEQNLAQTLGVDLCGNAPCFQEFIPGVTSWDAAELATKRFYNRRVRANSICIDFESGTARNKIEICPAVGPFLGDLSLEVGQINVPIATFILKYGLPCAVDVASNGQPYRILYSNFVIDVNSGPNKVTGHFDPFWNVIRVQLLDPKHIRIVVGCLQQFEERKVWSGFANYNWKP
jgi:hypothetical protein